MAGCHGGIWKQSDSQEETMSDGMQNIKGVANRTLGKKLSRRRLMGTGAASLGAAVFAGGAASSAIAGGAFGGGRVVVAQDGGTEYHGAYPYVDPGSGGHFNTFVTDGILPTGTVYGELIMQPLGMYFWEADEWLPLLATEWSFINSDTFAGSDSATPSADAATPVSDEANTFEIKLREGVVWSDDTPFTAKDVVDTLWCFKIMSNTAWQYIDDAVAVDDLTVHCHMAVPSTVVERYVIRTMLPRPSSIFGEWAEQARQVFKEQGKTIDDPEGAQLLEQFTTFRPELPPASGPYQIDEASISNAQMTLVKNDKAWNADMALFDRIINFNGETDTISAVVLNKDVDYATHGFAPATEQEFLNTGIRVLRPPVYSGPALCMNFATLGDAFGDKKVRQGLAHAIDGDQIGFFSLAESGVPVTYYAGFSDNIIQNWLSQEDIDGMNQYPLDAEAASALLQEAGWTKDGDAWKTPAGEDASFELIFPAEFADWSAAGVALADQLTLFGIATEPRAITHTQVPIDVDQGNFQLAIQAWGNSSNPHPHFSYVTAFFDRNTLAVNNGGEGIAFPLEQSTDVAGDVDLNALVVSSARGLDVEAQKADVTVMAQVFNELLPKIPLFERYGNNAALEGVRVAAWPADDDPILKNSPYADGIPTMLIYQGLLEPVQG
jgi:peptide/nickel transport system substrate-binding protein